MSTCHERKAANRKPGRAYRPIKSPDHRILTPHMLGNDGEWRPLMTANYRRET